MSRRRNAGSRGFLAELKRRKVFRMAMVYAATAFVVLQAADLLATGLLEARRLRRPGRRRLIAQVQADLDQQRARLRREGL